MRNTCAFFTLVLGILMILPSCSKELDNNQILATPASAEQVVSATVRAEETYTLSFAQSSGVIIHKQATHFKISTTIANNETGKITYQYVPETGYTGGDEVILSSTKIVQGNYNRGCNPGNNDNRMNDVYSKTFITVKINVTK